MSLGVGPSVIVGATDGKLIVGGDEGNAPTDWEYAPVVTGLLVKEGTCVCAIPAVGIC